MIVEIAELQGHAQLVPVFSFGGVIAGADPLDGIVIDEVVRGQRIRKIVAVGDTVEVIGLPVGAADGAVDTVGEIQQVAWLQGLGIRNGSAIAFVFRELGLGLVGQGLRQRTAGTVEIIYEGKDVLRLVLVLIGLGETEEQGAAGPAPALTEIQGIGNIVLIGMTAVVGAALVAEITVGCLCRLYGHGIET